MSETHTPTPWNVGEYEDVYGPDGELIHVKGFALSRRGVPNAAFIVTAVNSHADMLAALRQMVVNSENDGHSYRDCHRNALAAIAKAETP